MKLHTTITKLNKDIHTASCGGDAGGLGPGGPQPATAASPHACLCLCDRERTRATWCRGRGEGSCAAAGDGPSSSPTQCQRPIRLTQTTSASASVLVSVSVCNHVGETNLAACQNHPARCGSVAATARGAARHNPNGPLADSEAPGSDLLRCSGASRDAGATGPCEKAALAPAVRHSSLPAGPGLGCPQAWLHPSAPFARWRGKVSPLAHSNPLSARGVDGAFR